MTHVARYAPLRTLLIIASVALAIQSGLSAAVAGGGPENVFLVVNARSWASQTVANHFIRLRHIPANNVMYLNWTGDNDTLKVDAFRSGILNPILAAIDARGLTPQIDYIVYSSDFPYRINYQTDLTREDRHSLGSINGMTFLAPLVLKKDINGYLGLASNQYMGRRHPDFGRGVAYGFRSGYGWDVRGDRVETGGRHHYLSTMLAVTSGRGNSVPEAISYLTRAAAADGRRPRGTVYYVKNDDIRSTTRERSKYRREPGFEIAVAALKKLGVAAEIIPGTKSNTSPGPLPIGKKDVCGVMIGAHKFNWSTSRSTILPGAICEHFTSFGGVFHPTANQTPLSELLRYGAAGASGTVTEPLATQEKFPVPLLQSYYAQGSTLAEAFYQSVMGPYQLLIVGDPLCRPWARIPQVTVTGVQPGATVQGVLNLAPKAQVDGVKINHFELFVDGRRGEICQPGAEFRMDTTELADGYHELRVVAVADRPRETQGRAIVPIMVSNQSRVVRLQASTRQTVVWNKPLTLTVTAAGADGCEVYHNSRLLGTIEGASGRLKINPKDLGHGPVTIRAIARFTDMPTQEVAAPPLELIVKPNSPRPGRRVARTQQLRPGLQLRAGRAATVPIQRTAKYVWLKEAGVRKDQDYSYGGYFQVVIADVYQFQVRHIGTLSVEVDGAKVYEGAEEDRWQQTYVPLSLGPGLHTLRVRGHSARTTPSVDLRFGNSGVDYVDGRQFHN